MHKKRAQFSLFCTLPKPWTGHPEYMKRKCALLGASPLTCRSGITTNMSSILVERLVSVDANSRRSGFLPAAPKFCGFGPSLPPQNAMNYTTLPAHEKPPPKIGRGPPSIHQTPTMAGARQSCLASGRGCSSCPTQDFGQAGWDSGRRNGGYMLCERQPDVILRRIIILFLLLQTVPTWIIHPVTAEASCLCYTKPSHN